MDKPFRVLPLETLARWIFRDLDHADAVMGIPRANFEVPDPRFASTIFGRKLAAPLGVAAGPHTQLSQNIVSSWLCGARFIELKTVQILDELEVARPCIDAADATFNCEWSQELKLEQSFTEYLNAWVMIHALAHRFGLPDPGTVFSMSVGYDLKGIQSPRVQAFVAAMRDAGAEVARAVETVAAFYPPVRDLAIPGGISNQITLSTMHGCPPAEIERIARHLLLDLGVHTWVKLNPTLLGPETVRGLLNDSLGWDIEVPDAAFDHDPRFDDALAMVERLAAAAQGGETSFGLKLSNTLEVVNRRGVFPASEKMMYLSGRALHPVTLALARRMAEATGGRIPLSFCGGADARNFPSLVADGLGPVTVCTDLLKPGGYARLQPYLVNLGEALSAAGARDLQAFVRPAPGGEALARHAVAAAAEPRFARRERPLVFKGDRPLGAFDCIAAPCQDACPTGQNIPDYLWQVAQGRPTESLEIILRTNPLPGMTGSVCDRPCIERCVRNFYDAPLAIREIKRFAYEAGTAPVERPGAPVGIKVAVIGAGPAGLSAAYFLAKLGFAPEVFEAKADPGGMVAGVIPGYRITEQSIEGDLARLRELGVPMHYGRALGRDLALADLRRDFPYIFLGIGAQRGKRLGIPGEDAPQVLDALDFLDRVRAGDPVDLGRRVLIIGGGNTAMDAARSARRLLPEGEVTLVYRRTRAQMPADHAEVLDALEEGVGLRDLLAPEAVVVADGRVTGLRCAAMRLGPPDASGRPRPVPVGGDPEVLAADCIIPAISQEPDLDFLAGLDLARTRDGGVVTDPATGETSLAGLFAGGDMVRGPASVIKAIADGRAAAEAIARRHGVAVPEEALLDKSPGVAPLMEKKARLHAPQTVPVLPVAQRRGFDEVNHNFTAAAAAAEASRCLDCDDLCSLCVTVCPNRANLGYAMAPLKLDLPVLAARGGRLVQDGATPFAVHQGVQILTVGDFCNACGNCDSFCPTSGAPYKDKPHVWVDPQGFEEAPGDAYRLRQEGPATVVEARLGGRMHSLRRTDGAAEYRTPDLRATLDPASWALLSAEPLGVPEEGRRFDLAPLGTLVALLAAESVLPPGPVGATP